MTPRRARRPLWITQRIRRYEQYGRRSDLLIERGAPIDAPDGKGRTPLALAVRACVDSYWKERRSPESVRALLHAGASVAGVAFPSSYTDVDELLKSHGATA